MDSSPVNPYLLFESADAFRPSDKVSYALKHPIGQKGARGLRTPSQLNDYRYLIRSLEELRRMIALPVTANPITTFTEQFASSSYSSPETSSTPMFLGRTHGVPVEDAEDYENEPWDNIHSGTSVWHWPVEVLYQRYHLLIAIDFSFSTFGVSRNGKVLVDYVPFAIQAILDVVKKTIQTREQEEKEIRHWVNTCIEESERDNILRQVWNPQVDISIVLINSPRMEVSSLTSVSPNFPSAGTGCAADMDGQHPHLFPVGAVPFPTFEGDFPSDTISHPLLIPLMTRCNAKLVLSDESLLSRLEHKLRAYEEVCCSRLVDVWPDRSLFATMEHLIRLIPERSSHCTSLVLLSNADRGGSHNSVALLESSVRRKNIIFSLLFLNETNPLLDSNTNALSQFLSAVGGVGVHFDHWLSLAAPRLNIDWCRRFGGPRCLAQQLFVQLDNKFPVGVDHVSQNVPTTASDRAGDCCVLYNSDNFLEDFTLFRENDVTSVLRCVAEARVSEGWSVVMNHSAENPHVAHLYARFHCNLRRGKLFIVYEMEITCPVVYRRVVVSGSKDLVEYFVRAEGDDRTLIPARREAKTGWLVYLVILRSQLRNWMRAEQVALQCLLASQQTRRPSLKEIQELSFSEGVSSGWSAHCSVRSVGFFFRWEDGLLHFLDPCGSGGGSWGNMPSVSVLARRVLGAALRKRHNVLFHDESDVFLSLTTDEGSPRYLAQVFLLDNEFANGHGGVLAAGFECRFSFFLTGVEEELQALADVIADVKAGVSATRSTTVGDTSFALAMEAGIDEANARALHLTFCAVMPRRLELISGFIEPSRCGRNVVPRGLMNRRALRLCSSMKASQGEEIRTFRHLTFRCFLTPYLVSPWVLSDALAFHWMIGTAEMWRTFAVPSFGIFVARRVRNGFRLLHCVGCRKAILYATRLCGGCHAVEIFDVIEAPSEGGNSDLPAQVIIYRFIRPFEFAVSSLYRQELTADISEDIQVATVLHTFKVLSSAPLTSAVERPVSSKDLGRGFVRLVPRPESLLPFLSARHVHTITLRSLPSMGGKGDDDLRDALALFVSSLGDRSATVDASALPEGLRHKLSGLENLDESSQGQNTYFFSVLMPLECNYLTFLLMSRGRHATTLRRAKDINVYVVSLETAALFKGVIRLYGGSGEGEDVVEPRLPDCSASILLNALTKLLTCFCSLYQAWRLLEEQRDGMGCQAAEEAMVAQDVLRTFSTFEDYCKEVDISYLLYVHDSKWKDHGCEISLHEGLRSLVTSMVRSMCLRPLPTHPAVFLPVNENIDSPAEGVLGDVAAKDAFRVLRSGGSANRNSTVLPFLMRIALFLVSEDGRDVDCVCLFSPEQASDESGDAYLSFWSPITSDGVRRASQRRLLMRFFVKTAPKQLVDLSRNNYNPPPEVIRRVFREMLRDRQEGRVADANTPPLFFAKESSVEELNLLSRQALPFDELPAAVQRLFDVLASDLATSVARHCLMDCLHSAPFGALRSIIEAEATPLRTAAALTAFECDNANDGSSNIDDDDLDGEAGYLHVLAHESQEVLNAVRNISGLTELLAFAVSPALLSAPCFEADSFTVELPQQFLNSSVVSPALALSHVFRRCFADDLVCVVEATASSFLLVPGKKYFASRWIFICVAADARDDAQRVRLLFSEHEGDLDACRRLCRSLRRLIEAKIREVSQLHLLKQLRDTQNANNELIPRGWGDQFSSPPPAARGNREPTASLPAALCCRGSTVLRLPIYYKLQHQCKKILSRITSNCSRLELINIYNREQCFVVADDVQTDVFHFIRLVFVKDTAHLPSLTVPSPSLSPADRCPLLAVQLFGSTKNALVKRPLRKLQDFCFFLAIQELQGHLNYVQHKLISSADLIFLQCRRRDPVIVDLAQVGGGESVQPMDVRLAFALVVLGLKENKFKSFDVRDGGNTAVSNFAEYYGLVEGEEEKGGGGGGTSGSSLHVASPREMETQKTTSLLPASILRFVKVIEGVTDMLVSCALRVSDGSQLVVDRFLTKMPEERHTVGESEMKCLRQIEDVVRDAVSQWRFFALSRRFCVLSSCEVVSAVEELIAYGACVTSMESSTLRFRNFSLDRISHAVFPFLIERLVGVFEPFSPVAFLKRSNAPPLHIAGFPWRWMEQMQRDLQAEQIEVYLTCGYHITVGGGQSEEQLIKATRAVHETHPDLPVSRATVLAQSPLLKEHNMEAGMPAEPRVVVRISLKNGVTAALFNLRDSDILLRLMGHVIARAERQSDLLHDIMVQRMGLSLPSYLTEPALARFCCGDDNNVTEEKRVCIHDETYRRRINHVRFPLCHSPGGDPLTIIVEGLFNRGLCVNGVFLEDDAIRVLHDECPQYSLRECKRVLQGLASDGLLVMGPKANSHRLANSNSIPDDALIGCDFHRHVQTAHILVESQHTRSGITESLQDCESLLNSSSPESEMSLAKLVVLLQGRSKQVFGSRVQDFTLPRRLPWCLADDILDPSLPPRGKLGSEYRLSVDATLQSYVQYLLRVFPTARVIDLDANNAIVSSDATLLHRLCCRYGKVVASDGNEIRFVPHLYYVLIPIADARGMERGDGCELAASTSLRNGGLFIVEVGFQVAHFALDVFMASGESLSASVAASTAVMVKRNLIFSSVLYDLTVNRMLRYVQMYASLLFGQLLTSDALESLVRQYPHPPCESLNIVAVFDVGESCVRWARKLTASNLSEGSDSNGMRQLIPKQGELLWRESTQERYHYCGVMVWATSRLFVLLSTVRDVTMCDRYPSGDLPKLALSAKRQLLQLLLDSMLQQRLEFAWEKIRAPLAEIKRNDDTNNDADGIGGSEQGPAREDLRTLQTHWRKYRLVSISKPFLHTRLDWKSMLTRCHGALVAACAPNFSLHLFLDGPGENLDGAHWKDANNNTVALTLATRQTERRCFVVVEFTGGSSGSIESAALYRGTNERGAADKPLDEEEAELIEQTLRLLSSALWGRIHT